MFNTPYQSSMQWFEGIVEDVNDPAKLGRVRVRVFGLHTDNINLIPTQDLHWMQVVQPAKLEVGMQIVGFFRDGNNSQDGIVIGYLNGIPQSQNNPSKGFNDTNTNISNYPRKVDDIDFDGNSVSIQNSEPKYYPENINEPETSRLARNENVEESTVNKLKLKSRQQQIDISVGGGSKFSEPMPPYATIYPYNTVTETRSGHVMELDDTPNAERVHIAHRTGSFIEFHPDGKLVTKSISDQYIFSHGNSYEHVSGVKQVKIDNGAKALINGALEIEVGAGGNLILKVAGDLSIECDGDFNVSANTINLN